MDDSYGLWNVESDFEQPVAKQIWRTKYQYRRGGYEIDLSLMDTHRRVAAALARPEDASQQGETTQKFMAALKDCRLLPAGRILAGAGTARDVTLSNTFVMRTIPDTISGIMDTAKEAALTMQMGGGLGYDFSTIRPRGMPVRGLDCPAAGPLAAMDICDTVCRMVVSGMGRGAMMATLRCDHPDILDFINAKADRNRLRNFNLSVLVSDRFMQAVAEDAPWDLVWRGAVVRSLPARQIWEALMRQTYQAAEPGVLFIDRINAANPLNYLETISATNSCAEQPLPPNGTCPLASVNLARLITDPFSGDAALDRAQLADLTATAVHMLDNALDVSRYPLAAQRDEAMAKRRIGIGVTGVGNALAMLNVRYGSAAAAALVSDWMRLIQNTAYRASARLAEQRGAFPLYDPACHLDQPMIRALDPDVQALIRANGLRNGALTSIAPTGTISMLAGNVSSGIEPIFATSFRRVITGPDGTKTEETVMDYAVWRYRRMFGPAKPLPAGFVTAAELTPACHVAMQAAAQKWVDGGISKTVNCGVDISFESFQSVYLDAYQAGCKGCTTFRPNDVTGAVLS